MPAQQPPALQHSWFAWNSLTHSHVLSMHAILYCSTDNITLHLYICIWFSTLDMLNVLDCSWICQHAQHRGHTCLKSQGQRVSFSPSVSSPLLSRVWEPWPAKTAQSFTKSQYSSTNHDICFTYNTRYNRGSEDQLILLCMCLLQLACRHMVSVAEVHFIQ